MDLSNSKHEQRAIREGVGPSESQERYVTIEVAENPPTPGADAPGVGGFSAR